MNIPLKIILADKNNIYRRMIKNRIEEDGIGKIVASVSTGQELVEAALGTNADLIISDTELGGLSGINAICEIQQKKTDNCPLVFISASLTDDFTVQNASEADIYYFIQKPYDINDLTDKIEQLKAENCKDNNIIYESHKIKRDIKQPAEEDRKFLEFKITELFNNIGIPPHVKGHKYLREAIMASVYDMDMLNGITKKIYPLIAHKYNTTASSVERAIRNAIEIAWTRGDLNFLKQLFGYTVSKKRGKPTNSEFISMLSDKLKLEF